MPNRRAQQANRPGRPGLVKEYIDDGYSGKMLGRPALEDLRRGAKGDVYDTGYISTPPTVSPARSKAPVTASRPEQQLFGRITRSLAWPAYLGLVLACSLPVVLALPAINQMGGEDEVYRPQVSLDPRVGSAITA